MPSKKNLKNQAWKKTSSKKKALKRPAGTVTSGLLQSKHRYQNHSLLLGTVPKVGNTDLKYIDSASDTNYLPVTNAYSAMNVITHEPLTSITSVGGAPQNGIIQDNGISGRIASKVFLKKLEARCIFEWPSVDLTGDTSGAGGYLKGRMLVVLDKQPNQTLATPDQVLDGDNTQDITSRMVNYSNVKRFKVLCDKSFSMPPQHIMENDYVPAAATTLDFEVDLQGNTTLYASDTSDGLFDDVMTNNVIMFFTLNHAKLSSTSQIASASMRVRTRLYFTG